jgi:NADH:ubiquinone oxidoreductase subunit 6 (subunit J)
MANGLEIAVFGLMAAIAIGGALGTVYANRVAHSLLFLVFSFLAVAGVFILMAAELLAAIQILVYLGSILLVVLFGVMLTRRQIQEEDFE